MTHPIYINSIASVSPQPSFEGGGERQLPHGKQLRAIEPDYKASIPNAALRRRMSRIVRMGVAAGLECLTRGGNTAVDAILTATGLGCLSDTERFLNTLFDNDEQLLNPTAFIQSTFNTIGAQIALLSKNHACNTTYVHRGFSFESALLDGMMQLAGGEAQSVLAGAVDELTPAQFRVMERMGCWRNAVAGEGAQFFLIGRQPVAGCYAELIGIDTFQGPLAGGEVEGRTGRFLASHGVEQGAIDWLLTGGDIKAGARTVTPFKPLCGEYPTAASFALWLACKVLRDGNFCGVLPPGQPSASLRHVLIYNTYGKATHTLYLLKRH